MSLVQETRPYDALYGPAVVDHRASRGTGAVSGSHRAKFFAKPPTEPIHTMPANLQLAPTDVGPETEGIEQILEDEPLVKDVEIQTKFRESEAQTEPYTPAFVLDETKEPPEVLSLQRLTAKNGIAEPTVHDIEMVDWTRANRRMREAMPPFTDEASLEMRKRIMEKQEVREFQMRDDEVQRRNDARVEALKERLAERDEMIDFVTEQRIENLRQQKIERRDLSLHRVQSHRVKVLRKLAKARAKAAKLAPGSGRRTRDIISEYADYSSSVYAPALRNGRVNAPDADSFDISKRSSVLKNSERVRQLAAAVPAKILDGGMKASEVTLRSLTGPSYSVRDETRRIADALDLADRVIQTRRNRKAALAADVRESPSSARLTRKMSSITSAFERPPTPSVIEDPGEEAQEQRRHEQVRKAAVVFLQRLIRGRAVQNAMYDGKERKKELLRELQASQADPISSDVPTSEEKQDAVVLAVRDTVAGEIVSSLLYEFSQGREASEDSS
eukprot:scaffold4058_cov257-Pinguiococcus_pyrenoidosus.AAC.7